MAQRVDQHICQCLGEPLEVDENLGVSTVTDGAAQLDTLADVPRAQAFDCRLDDQLNGRAFEVQSEFAFFGT